MVLKEPNKMIPINGLISKKLIYDGEKIPNAPENCYYEVEFDYDYSHTDFWLVTKTSIEIPNPKYEEELKAYKKELTKIKHYKKLEEEKERIEYERLKKKFGD